MKLVFDKHNINIPYPQIVLNQPSEFTTASYSEKRKSRDFVNDQKEKSKEIGLEDDDN